MVGPPSDQKDQAAFIFKALLKKLAIPLLVVFWCYTWHAYSVGAIGQKDYLPNTPQTVFKSDTEKFQSLGAAQGKTQFKRRPFIAKGDVVFLEPFESKKIFSFSRHQNPLKIFLFQAPSAPSNHLRSPPLV